MVGCGMGRTRTNLGTELGDGICSDWQWPSKRHGGHGAYPSKRHDAYQMD